MRRLGVIVVVATCACGKTEGPRADAAGETGIASVGDTGGATTSSASTDDGDMKLDLPTMMISDVADTSDEDCDGLTATIRDFSESHPDFEDYTGDGPSLGLVLAILGPDTTPQYNPAYAGAPMITSADTFAQWYHDVPGTNIPFPIDLPLTEETPGVFVYDSSAFFPIDGQGFGDEGNDHNFHFTTEVHTSFTYGGGETFTFRGDDDLWMFVNGLLAIDLGGLHPAAEGMVAMDTLGLTIGETYPMDIFHAERHTDQSNFRIATTIACFQTPPPPG